MSARRILMLLAVAGAALVVILGARALLRPRPTEEEIVLELVRRLGDAAEQRDAKLLREHTSERYRDQQGRGKAEIGQMLSLYFLRPGIINVYVVRSSVDAINKAASPMSARVSATVLLTRGPRVKKLSDLVPEAARALRFDVELEKEGEVWRAISARWDDAGSVRDYIR
jgi:hypothetical protein